MIAYDLFELSKSENCTAGVSYTLKNATQSTGEPVKTAAYPRFLKRRQRNWEHMKRGEFFLNFRPWFGKPAESGLIGFLVNCIEESTVAMYSDNELLREGLSYGFRDWQAYIMRRRYDRMTIYRCAEKDFHTLLEKIQKEENV